MCWSWNFYVLDDLVIWMTRLMNKHDKHIVGLLCVSLRRNWTQKWLVSKLKELNLPVINYCSLIWFIRWLPNNSQRIRDFQECYWKVLDILLADITDLISFDTKPLYCTVLVSKCKLTFTTTVHPKGISPFPKLHQTNPTNCFFLWNILRSIFNDWKGNTATKRKHRRRRKLSI